VLVYFYFESYDYVGDVYCECFLGDLVYDFGFCGFLFEYCFIGDDEVVGL